MNRACLTLLAVMIALCTTSFPHCTAVRLNLQDLLQFYEEQQNPENEQTEHEEGFVSSTPSYTEDDINAGGVPSMPQEPDLGFLGEEEEEEEAGSGTDNLRAFLDREVLRRMEAQGALSTPEVMTSATMTTKMTTKMTTELLTTEEPGTTRTMSTCCILGERAGRNRHHCNPDTYLPRMYRHRNRGHNFKQTNKHPSQVKTQLDKCVSGQVRRLALDFQTCCQEAYKRLWKEERGHDNLNYDRTHILEIPFTK